MFWLTLLTDKEAILLKIGKTCDQVSKSWKHYYFQKTLGCKKFKKVLNLQKNFLPVAKKILYLLFLELILFAIIETS